MNNNYYIASTKQMDNRRLLAEVFYKSILDSEDIPYIVTDEACFYDFFAGDECSVINKIKEMYGVAVNVEQFKMPFWKLLDLLNK
jgi:thymidine kinase